MPFQLAGPSLSILPDNSKLAQFGLTPASFQAQVQLSLQGLAVGNILEKEQLSVIRLVYQGSRTQSIDGIKHLMIFLPSGHLKAISELAAVKLNVGDAQVERENLQSMGVITSRLENRDLGRTIKEIQQKIGTQVKLPLGYHIEYGGEYARQQQSWSCWSF